MTDGATTNRAKQGTSTTAQASKAYDDRVLERVRAGDSEAYAELVDRYGDRLFQVLLPLANHDHEQAAEFVQEAFIRAFERLDRFDGRSGFYTWLYRLARNRAIDLLAKRRPVASSDTVLESAAGAGGIAPDAATSREELHAQVHSALERLQPEQREIIILRDFDGLDYPSIAAFLEIAEGTVKSRLNRARSALRSELAGHISGADL